MGPGFSRFLLYLPMFLEDGLRDDRGMASAAVGHINDHGVVRLELGHVRGVAALEPHARLRSGRGQINRCWGSSFPESRSSTRTNGLRADPGRMSCLLPKFGFFAPRISQDSTSMTAIVPAEPLRARSTSPCKRKSYDWSSNWPALEKQPTKGGRTASTNSVSGEATDATVSLKITLSS